MSDMIQEGAHGCSAESSYVQPKDPLIQERLEWFRDQKLALMMHYGPYSQLGVDASWSLSDGDASWSRRTVDWESDSAAYRKQYVEAYKTFNPIRIQPDKWADFAAENGFRYLIFTTKHHDGFCMWDTKYTDYRITAEDLLSRRSFGDSIGYGSFFIDIQLTRKLSTSGRMMGIPLLDHIIIGKTGYFSFKNHNMLE